MAEFSDPLDVFSYCVKRADSFKTRDWLAALTLITSRQKRLNASSYAFARFNELIRQRGVTPDNLPLILHRYAVLRYSPFGWAVLPRVKASILQLSEKELSVMSWSLGRLLIYDDRVWELIAVRTMMLYDPASTPNLPAVGGGETTTPAMITREDPSNALSAAPDAAGKRRALEGSSTIDDERGRGEHPGEHEDEERTPPDRMPSDPEAGESSGSSSPGASGSSSDHRSITVMLRGCDGVSVAHAPAVAGARSRTSIEEILPQSSMISRPCETTLTNLGMLLWGFAAVEKTEPVDIRFLRNTILKQLERYTGNTRDTRQAIEQGELVQDVEPASPICRRSATAQESEGEGVFASGTPLRPLPTGVVPDDAESEERTAASRREDRADDHVFPTHALTSIFRSYTIICPNDVEFTAVQYCMLSSSTMGRTQLVTTPKSLEVPRAARYISLPTHCISPPTRCIPPSPT